jgi:hypothetical protein
MGPMTEREKKSGRKKGAPHGALVQGGGYQERRRKRRLRTCPLKRPGLIINK